MQRPTENLRKSVELRDFSAFWRLMDMHCGGPMKIDGVGMGIVLAFDKVLGIAEALHTDLNTTAMIAGTDWDERTPTKQFDEALPHPEKVHVI
ncbi:hypothetical protein FMUND_5980 [Fusarium mundagurra]|uniref:Uncharacterized protein n=1 Tax=Fusarium mundagurra TaxID=1567541 RepID=A0A8H6DJC3_9HYPO|nr:hypothetical protein FMUND_5980 [Fusarium mundagurra]